MRWPLGMPARAKTCGSTSSCLRQAAGRATSSTPGSLDPLGIRMTLRVAVQMDPLETININGDSTFHLMLAAQARGHELWHYDVRTLALETDSGAGEKLTCWAA